jgi:phage terminase small subunit
VARPRKDPALKALKGTLRKDREPRAAPAAIASAMVAPVPLTPRALEHFDGIVALLSAEGRSSQHFAYTVTLLAQRIHQAEQLQTVLADEGVTYDTVSVSGSVMHRARPEVAMLADALRHQQSLLSELMLSPTAAQRLGKREAPVSNPFDEL